MRLLSSKFLRRYDLQIAERASLLSTHNPTFPFSRLGEAIDDQAGLLRVVDPHPHLLLRHLDAGVEPTARVGNGFHG